MEVRLDPRHQGTGRHGSRPNNVRGGQVKKIAALVAVPFMALGLAFATVGTASAANPITATTSVTAHPDTTAASGGACLPGNVWAYDYYTENISATKEANPPNTYSVTVTDTGTYYGFANPNTCAAELSTG